MLHYQTPGTGQARLVRVLMSDWVELVLFCLPTFAYSRPERFWFVPIGTRGN